MTYNEGVIATRILAALLIGVFCAFASPASAQLLGIPTNAPQDVIIELSPANPGAEAPVTASAVSYSNDLSNVSLRWTLNGSLVAEGVGRTSVTFTSGRVGSTQTLAVSAALPGGIATARAVIRPAGLSLLWEAESYVPPLYKGKALLPFDGAVRLLAVPVFIDSSGNRIGARSLNYTWKQNGVVIGPLSGRGRSDITLAGPKVYRPLTVSVEVASADGSMRAEESITFSGQEPRILFYENDPLLGYRFEHAITDSLSLSAREVTITAFPYFFSGATRQDGALQFAWSVNDEPIENPGNDRGSLTLRQTTAGGGTAAVGLSIQNLREIFQAAQGFFSINFALPEGSVL